MFICLHHYPDERELWIRAMDVKSIERAEPEKDKSGATLITKPSTIVATTLITNQGPFAYRVTDEPGEIAKAVAAVLQNLPAPPALNPAQR